MTSKIKMLELLPRRPNVLIFTNVVCTVVCLCQKSKKKSQQMASASSSSAKNLFADSKARINQRVKYTVDGVGSLCRNIVRTSKSSEVLMQAAKSTSQAEGLLESADLVNIILTVFTCFCNDSKFSFTILF